MLNVLPNEHELIIWVCSGDHSWSFKSIMAMTMTMTINSNSVLLVSVASAGQYESFKHVQKFCVPSTNNFHSCLCTLKMCSYCLCHTAYVLYSSRSYHILVVLNCILGHSYMTVKLWQQKTVRMELEDCCKVDIRVNSPLFSSSLVCRFGTVRLGHYTWRVCSYIFLLFSYLIQFILVRSCQIPVVLFLCSYFYWERTVPNYKKKNWRFDEEEWVRISNFLHLSTFGNRYGTVTLGH